MSKQFRMDYRTYDTSAGRGSSFEWRNAFRFRMGVDAARATVRDESPRSILGVGIGATWEEIKSAWRALVLQHHPDRGGDPAQFRKVQAAFEVLECEFGQ